MSIDDACTALAADGMGSPRTLAAEIPFRGIQALGIEGMNACGRAGTRGGGS
jgi:hypothetical protein